MDFARQPILVFWETTRACLLACRHCRAEAIERPLEGELTTAEGIALIEECAGFGATPPVLIFTGGDLLMRTDIFELVGHARSLGMPVGLSPSVTPLLTAETIERIKSLDAKTVSISMDGAVADTHEGIRGIKGHFARTIEAIEALVHEGLTVQVNTSVMRDNAHELADIAALLVEIGVPIWEVFFLIKVGRGADVTELDPRQNEDVAHFLYDASGYGLTVRTVEGPFFRRVAASRRELAEDADPIEAFELGPLYRRLAGILRARLGEPTRSPRAQSSGTRDGRGIIFVAHNGEIYPSGFMPLALGNVREQGIVDVYRSHPLLVSIRKAEFDGRCGRCEFRESCGGSRARALAATGDPLGEDPACGYMPTGFASRRDRLGERSRPRLQRTGTGSFRSRRRRRSQGDR